MIGGTNILASGGISGGVLKAWAVIKVTYPAGSVCTCTKGSKSFRAKDTTGEVIFGVPEAGDWVVSCTDGTETKARTVSITTEYQIENVRLSFSTDIFRSGQGCCMNMYQGKYNSAQENPQDLHELGYTSAFDVTNERFTHYGVHSGIGFFTEKFDATELTTLSVDMELHSNSMLDVIMAPGDQWPKYFSSPAPSSGALAYVRHHYSLDGKDRLTKSVDISSVTGEVYITGWDAADNGVKRYTVYNIWCE